MLGILGGGFFTYKYVTSEQFQNKMINKVLGEVGGMMPKVLDNALPEMTRESIPIKPYSQPTTMEKVGI